VEQPLLLVLDGVTDPHNLGACLRVADGAGAHAVIAPKDHAVGINATVAKVASGAAETMPYFMVTNLARTLNELKERNIWIIGTSDDAPQDPVPGRPQGPGRAGAGRRGRRHAPAHPQDLRRARQHPMKGAVESLNVSVASGVCLYEALRQRAV
jgi:23S rRNA (guanosine2251-2'-O)-methyltransferase